ncbi:MAG: hypothetical protein HQL63_13430 [Magnetococcales bacterium]|nr:hypothetical protein [Magnetococcales bacterium]MBF0322697.1 hypothetical protein [Magnetococcales bacterium]
MELGDRGGGMKDGLGSYVGFFKRFSFSLAVAVAIFIYGVKYTYYSWDIVPYIASTYSVFDGYSGENLRVVTYGDLEKEVDPLRFKKMTTGPFGALYYRDWRALEELVKTYNSARLFYLATIKGISKFGYSYSQASYISSSFFASLCIIITSIILFELGIPQPFVVFVAYYSEVHHLAQFSSPDSMACFFSLLLMYFLMKNKIYSSFVVASVLPIVRIDYVIVSVLVSFYLFYFKSKKTSLFMMISSIFVCFIVAKVFTNYQFLRHFNNTFIDMTPNIAATVISKSASDYLIPYMKCFKEVYQSHVFAIYVFAVLALLFRIRHKIAETSDYYLVVSIGFMLIHLLAHPAYEARYYSFSVAVAAICLLRACREASTFAPHT